MKKMIAMILTLALFSNCLSVSAKDEGVDIHIELLQWEEVNDILPRYSKFTVLDVETGKRFEVQRRAGNRHADVQPLTPKDTKIMKEIYGGKWSWKRRSIIVMHENQWIAASMHGMPHGAGSLPNNFPGHFCIHFYGSKTHRKNSMDISHQLMILKAAGKLIEYADSAKPNEVISGYMVGMKQHDPKIISAFSFQQIDMMEHIKSIENLNLERITLPPMDDMANELTLKVPVEIEMFIKDAGKRRFNIEIHLIRFSQTDAWKVDSIHLLNESGLFSEEDEAESR